MLEAIGAASTEAEVSEEEAVVSAETDSEDRSTPHTRSARAASAAAGTGEVFAAASQHIDEDPSSRNSRRKHSHVLRS